MKLVTTLFILFVVTLSSAQNSVETKREHTINAIGLPPISLLGGIAVNYEHLFGEKAGVFVEASGIFWSIAKGDASGFSTALHYRHHNKKKKNSKGLSSQYWGPTVTFSKNSATAAFATSKLNSTATELLPYELTSLKLGISGGRRWVFSSGFTLDFRGGYGLFPLYDMTWDDHTSSIKDDEKEFFETIMKVVGGIDLGISLGFAF